MRDSLNVKCYFAALKMALKKRKCKNKPILYYFDRGLEYCSVKYQILLDKNNILPSITEQYNSYKNAITERINGILKHEFDTDKYNTNLEIITKLIKNAIEIYNNVRPHLSNYMLKTNSQTA